MGPVSHSDVQLAIPLGARILGFNVRSAAGDVEDLAKMNGIEVRAWATLAPLHRACVPCSKH